MDDLISVIVPVYNMEHFLIRCLESICQNTYRNLEIICIDDGSTDRSLELLREYQKHEPRLLVITKANGGVSSARNVGMDAAKGEFISFVDPDDWLHPQYFEILLHAQKASSVPIVVCDHVQTCEDVSTFELMQELPPCTVLPVEEAFRIKDLKNSPWCKLYSRRDLHQKIRFSEGISFAEDEVFNLCFINQFPQMQVAYVQCPLYAYYNRPGSLVHNVGPDALLRVAKLLLPLSLEIRAERLRKHYLLDVIKFTLNARYRFGIVYPGTHPQIVACTSLLNAATDHFSQLSAVGGMEKLGFRCFTKFPALYRLFRILQDPTMRGYERMVKERYQKENKL